MKKGKKLGLIAGIVAAVLFLLYIFLVMPRMFGKADLSAFEGKIFAHRGHFDEVTIPENSLASFEAAIEAGYGIELDIQLSKDQIPMVFHDAELERMCGVPGDIWDYTAEELQQMKLMGTEQTIPTLEEVLAVIDGRTPLLVEYKMDVVDTVVCEKTHELLQNYKGDYCIQAFHPLVLIWYRQNAPEVGRGQLSQNFWNDEKYAGKPLYLLLTYMVENVATRPDFVSYKFSDQSNLSYQLCKLMGAKTAGWTIKSIQDYEQVAGSLDMVIADTFATFG